MPKRTSNLSIMPWVICLIAAIFYAYDYLIRVQPSVMLHELMHFYGTDAVGVGLLSAFYFYAYTPLQIPAGLIVDRYSTRMVLTLSAFICAVGTILFATVDNYYIALAARMMMGAGSAFAFMGALKLAALWLPHKYFTMYAGIATAMGTIGAISADTILSHMVVHIGWQRTVLITAFVGLAITILIFLFVRNKPKHIKTLPREFKSWSHTRRRLLFILKQWQFWVNGITGGLVFLPINVFASLWGIVFLKRAYSLTNQHASTAIALIFLGTAIGSPLAGWISDRIKKRKVPLFVGCGGCILLTFAILYETNVSNLSLYTMLFLLGFFAGAEVVVFSIAREISPPRTTGITTATTNFLVTMGAAVLQPLIGYLLVHFWEGNLSDKGVPIYSLDTYRHALLILPILLTVAFFLIFLIPETNCELKHKALKKVYK